MLIFKALLLTPSAKSWVMNDNYSVNFFEQIWLNFVGQIRACLPHHPALLFWLLMAPPMLRKATLQASLERVSSLSLSASNIDTLTVDVPFVQNAVAFEYTNPVVINVGDAGKDSFVASRFYLMNLNVSEDESWGLEATSTEDVSIAVAGSGNCPTWQFTNESIYWTGQISANQSKLLNF